MTGDESEIAGVLLLTHGGARVLTVKSPKGATWLLTTLQPEADFRVVTGATDDHPVQLHERRDGAIGELIRRHGIQILDTKQWNAMKQRSRRDG